MIQETRRWDDNKEYSYAMRSKEDAKDYRYFPDPDLPPVRISDQWIAQIRNAQPELQEEKAKRYMEQYELSDYDAGLLTQSRHLGEMFEQTAAICQMPKKAANVYRRDSPSGERRRHGNRRYFLLSGTSGRADPDDRPGRAEQ